MATLYVRSTDGSNGDNGTTWALAKADLAGVMGIDAAGDTIYVSHVHAETAATAQTWTGAGSVAAPVRIVCANDGAEPPTAVATTATVTNTNNSGNAFINTGNLYMYGLKFTWNVVFVVGNTAGDELQVYDNCQFIFAGGGSSCNMNDQASTGRKYFKFIDCQFKMDAAGEFITMSSSWYFRGGSFQSGTTTPTNLFRLGVSGRGSLLVVEDFDFSNCSSSLVLMDVGSSASMHAIFRNCKMPASWSTDNLISGSIAGHGVRCEMWNCDNGSTNYKMAIKEYEGVIDTDTANYRTGGYSDGTTPLSWKMTTITGKAKYPYNVLTTPEIVAWNDTTGSALTATIEILTNNVTLTDAEIWIELHYPGTSSQSIYTTITDAAATFLTTPANQTSSSESWTTTAGTPLKQKLSVTFTPTQKGPVYAKVVFCKNVTTVYVDPKLTIA